MRFIHTRETTLFECNYQFAMSEREKEEKCLISLSIISRFMLFFPCSLAKAGEAESPTHFRIDNATQTQI